MPASSLTRSRNSRPFSAERQASVATSRARRMARLRSFSPQILSASMARVHRRVAEPPGRRQPLAQPHDARIGIDDAELSGPVGMATSRRQLLVPRSSAAKTGKSRPDLAWRRLPLSARPVGARRLRRLPDGAIRCRWRSIRWLSGGSRRVAAAAGAKTFRPRLRFRRFLAFRALSGMPSACPCGAAGGLATAPSDAVPASCFERRIALASFQTPRFPAPWRRFQGLPL